MPLTFTVLRWCQKSQQHADVQKMLTNIAKTLFMARYSWGQVGKYVGCLFWVTVGCGPSAANFSGQHVVGISMSLTGVVFFFQVKDNGVI